MKPRLGNLFPTHRDVTVVSSWWAGIPNIILSSLLQSTKHDTIMYTTGYAKTRGEILILSGREHLTAACILYSNKLSLILRDEYRIRVAKPEEIYRLEVLRAVGIINLLAPEFYIKF
jgi:hypothetical protein